jgi:hypothetical protein
MPCCLGAAITFTSRHHNITLQGKLHRHRRAASGWPTMLVSGRYGDWWLVTDNTWLSLLQVTTRSDCLLGAVLLTFHNNKGRPNSCTQTGLQF